MKLKKFLVKVLLLCVSLACVFLLTACGRDDSNGAKPDLESEMSNFIYTSNYLTCTITGVKDKTVTKIVVPDYVTAISEGAFSGCSSLEEITIPFVGSKANATYNSPSALFGYIFGSDSYTGETAISQWLIRDSIYFVDSCTFYIPNS